MFQTHKHEQQQCHNDVFLVIAGAWACFIPQEAFYLRSLTEQTKEKDFGNYSITREDDDKLLFSFHPVSLSLSVLPTLSPFTFSLLCFTLLSEFLPFLSTVCFFLVSFSISLCTPTCSDTDCYARRIAPYTLTLCCKSFIENVEIFLREMCIISEFGCSLCSCLGTGPMQQFHCSHRSAVALCIGRI